MRTLSLLFLLVVLLPLQAGDPKVLPKGLSEAMQARMARGLEIYEYERLAWVASDLLMASKPDTAQFNMWVETRSEDRRYIFFGRFKLPQDPLQRPEGFGVAYSYWAPVGKPDEAHPVANPPMKPMKEQDEEAKRMFAALADTDELAKAADVARHQPNSLKVAWNYDVFKEKDGTITAYLMPGNSDSTVIPIGGDFRITFDASGTKVLKTVALHQSYLPLSTEGLPKGATPAGGYHSHLLEEDLPPETDLGILRLYPGATPHYLITRYGVFVFTDKYELKFLETKEEFMKKSPSSK